jgi:hypothetical protein
VRQALVTMRTPNGEEYDFRLGRRSFTVGRGAGCELALPAPEVSSVHARFDLDPARRAVFVTDLGSKNGTFVDGAPLVPEVATPVGPGSRVTIANITLTARFLEGAQDDSASLSFDTSASLSRTLLRGLLGEVVRQARARLDVVAGPSAGASLSIEERAEAVALGLGHVDLELREPALGGAALRVTQLGQGYRVVAPSAVSVWVGEQPVVGWCPLRDGAQIRVGQTRIVFSDPLQAAIDELQRLEQAERGETRAVGVEREEGEAAPGGAPRASGGERFVPTVRQPVLEKGRGYSWGERLAFAVAVLSLLAALGFLLVVLGVVRLD